MRVFLSSVHVRLVAKSTAPFQTGGGGEAKEGLQGDGRNVGLIMAFSAIIHYLKMIENFHWVLIRLHIHSGLAK